MTMTFSVCLQIVHCTGYFWLTNTQNPIHIALLFLLGEKGQQSIRNNIYMQTAANGAFDFSLFIIYYYYQW